MNLLHTVSIRLFVSTIKELICIYLFSILTLRGGAFAQLIIPACSSLSMFKSLYSIFPRIRLDFFSAYIERPKLF